MKRLHAMARLHTREVVAETHPADVELHTDGRTNAKMVLIPFQRALCSWILLCDRPGIVIFTVVDILS